MAKITTKQLREDVDKIDIQTEKIINLLKQNRLSLTDISELLDIPERAVKKKLKELSQGSYRVSLIDNLYFLEEAKSGKTLLNHKMWQGDNIKIGLVSDNHLGSNFAREDVLNMLYDLFEEEGIKTVIQTGNMIEGEARFNRNELKVWGFDNQCKYAVKKYPYRKGIITNFITADDHEGWFAQREGINFGEHVQHMRKDAGMDDFNHLGYLEADIELNGGKYPNEMWLRAIHPGGGSAYATSYSVQKIVESMQPGEKPSILIVGHYHKQLFFPVRGVWTIQPGCTCDQGIYLRKNKIEVALGGAILNITRNSDGIANRISCEFISVFDKKFYVGKDKYWK